MDNLLYMWNFCYIDRISAFKFLAVNSFTVSYGRFGRKKFPTHLGNSDLHNYREKMRIVYQHCFWSALRINRNYALGEYDSLNSCYVGTIFCLPILLCKRVTAVFAGALSTFISNCIGLFLESGWHIPAVCYDSRMRISMLFSDKWIKTIAWPSVEQKSNPNGLRAVHNSMFRSWMAQKWHRLCIFNSSSLEQEALRFVYIQTARDETTNANALH